MNSTVSLLSLTDHSVISKFCAPAWTKPRRRPSTPSPAFASPRPVSHGERVTNQVPLRSSVLTSSAVRMPSLSGGRHLAFFPEIERSLRAAEGESGEAHRIFHLVLGSRDLAFGNEKPVCRKVQHTR